MKRDELLAAWQAMSDRECDAAMGVDVMGLHFIGWAGHNGRPLHAEPTDEAPKYIDYYTTDHAAAYAVEERIAEMGVGMGVQLHRELVLEAMQIVTPECLARFIKAGHDSAANQHLWLLYHASPEQRCCAAWVCVKVREGEKS